MPSLFKETRPSHGHFNRVNILSPATPALTNKYLLPCRLATAPIEVRAWTRPGLAGSAQYRTEAFGELWRVNRDDEDDEELVDPFAAVEDADSGPVSGSSQRGTACLLWNFSMLEIKEPGTYYYRIQVWQQVGSQPKQMILEIDTEQIVVEPAAQAADTSAAGPAE